MNIMIVEDKEPVRNRLFSLIDGENSHKVIASVESAEEAIELLDTHCPDLIILDLGLPGVSGIDAVKEIKSACMSAEIMIFTICEDDEQVFACLKAGASGYILKDATPMQIVSAVEEMRAGGSPMSFSIARKVLKEFQSLQLDELKGQVSPLSKREEEIIEILYQGDSYKQVAYKLNLSIHTVHTHIKNIYRKLEVNSRAEAIFEAIKNKIVR